MAAFTLSLPPNALTTRDSKYRVTASFSNPRSGSGFRPDPGFLGFFSIGLEKRDRSNGDKTP